MNTPSDAKPAYTIKEAKNFIPFGTTKIYEAINAGDLKAKKYGKKTIILHDDLMGFLNALPSYGSEVADA